MRFVALALILLSFPILVAWLKQNVARRDWALFAVGLFTFIFHNLQVDAAIISWALWPGISRGIIVSPIDTIGWALILTRSGARNRLPFIGLILLYMVPATLSMAVSAVWMASLFVPLQTLRLLLTFIAVAGELHRPTALRSLFGGMSVGLMVQAGYVIDQKLKGVVQATGTAFHQNMLGMMVHMIIVPMLAAVLEGQRSKLVYAGIVAGLIIVAGGGSRAAMGITAAGLVLVLLLSLMRRMTPRKGKIMAAALVVAAVMVPLGLATLEDRFGDRSLVTEEEERAAFERAARAMADDHPLGVGANTYVTVSNVQGYAQRAGVVWNKGSRSAPVHNAYLLARAETGWLGNIMLIAMLVIPLIAGLRIAFSERSSPLGGVALGSSVAALMVMLHSNYEYAWFLEEPQRVYFLNMAIIAAASVALRRARREARKAKIARAREIPALAS